jgi:hypothetical protein
MASEEAVALTVLAVMALIVLGGPWMLLWLCNYGPTEE